MYCVSNPVPPLYYPWYYTAYTVGDTKASEDEPQVESKSGKVHHLIDYMFMVAHCHAIRPIFTNFVMCAWGRLTLIFDTTPSTTPPTN